MKLAKALLVVSVVLGLASAIASEPQSVEEVFELNGGFEQMRALHELAARSDSSRVQHLLFEANDLADPMNRRAAIPVLFSRLAEIDPHSAIALSRAGPFASDYRNYGEAWTSWGRVDMQAAIEAAADIQGRNDRNTVAQALYTANRKADRGVAEAIAEATGVSMSPYNIGLFVVQTSARSPDEAIAIINSLTSFEQQQTVINSFAGYLGRRDPQLAAQYTAKIENEQLRLMYAAIVEKQSTTADPRRAAERALQLPPGNARTTATAQAMYDWARRDPRGAAEFLDSIDSPMIKGSVAKMIASPLALQDPEYAVEWAKKTDPAGSEGLLPAVLMQYAIEDPAAALSSAMAVDDSAQRQQSVAWVVSGATQADPRAAVTLLDQIDDDELAGQAFSTVATIWMQSDPEAAVDWLASDPRTSQYPLDSSLCQAITSHNVDAALRLLESLDGDSARNMQRQIAQHMSTEQSLEEAMVFLESVPDDSDRQSLQYHAFVNAAQADPVKALNYAKGLPVGENRSTLLITAIELLSSHEPELAMDNIDEIDDIGTRNRLYTSAIQRLTHVDPALARQALARSRLPAEEYERLDRYITENED